MARTRLSPSSSRTPDYAIILAKEFGKLLQAARASSGMDQQSFADALGVSRTTVSNIERGTQRVFLDQLYRASEILGKPPSELLPPKPGNADVLVRAASDDPLSVHAERSFEKIIREMNQKYGPPIKN